MELKYDILVYIICFQIPNLYRYAAAFLLEVAGGRFASEGPDGAAAVVEFARGLALAGLYTSWIQLTHSLKAAWCQPLRI